MLSSLLFTTLLLFFLPQFCTSDGVNAFCTYHAYSADYPVSVLACSDGANGLMATLGYSDLSAMYPNVAAFTDSGWNSTNCGRCFKLTNKNGGQVVYISAVDQCGKAEQGGDTHFDLSPDIFVSLFGDKGVADGHGFAQWQTVDRSLCKGNKGCE